MSSDTGVALTPGGMDDKGHKPWDNDVLDDKGHTFARNKPCQCREGGGCETAKSFSETDQTKIAHRLWT